MEKVKYISSTKQQKVFRSNLLDLVAEDQYTDCCLVAEGKSVYAHRVILAAASSYFKKAFAENKETCPELTFENVSCDNLINCIRLIYESESA